LRVLCAQRLIDTQRPLIGEKTSALRIEKNRCVSAAVSCQYVSGVKVQDSAMLHD